MLGRKAVVRPVCLIILDGFGVREAAPDNAITLARMPYWTKLWQECPHTLLEASGLAVGLPDGQMGNSEVGHLNIGMGRVVYQDFTRINQAIRDKSFLVNPVLGSLLQVLMHNGRTLHVLGLLSPGGVHSHEDHLIATIEMAAERKIPVMIHVFLDGRDTPPQSAQPSLQKLDQLCQRYPWVMVASMTGRYWAMDRDQRWDRTEKAWRLIVDGRAEFSATTSEAALQKAYARGETDEFVEPTVIQPEGTAADHSCVQDGDAIIFMNFRADRARQLTQAFTEADFKGFLQERRPCLSQYVCLTSYGQEFSALPVVFPPQSLVNGFGEYVSQLHLRQLRIAETEKYAHVTYFFNGGVETPFPGEDRILVPSPKVATYDLQPEMSAPLVTDKLVEAIESGQYDAIICNYANGDMVGHTGNLAAAIQAIEALDACLARVVEVVRQQGGEVLITADHGNAEMMYDPVTQQPHTAHTLQKVPCVYVGRPAQIAPTGCLADIAPTLLQMMGLSPPAVMTGKPLLDFLG